MTMHLPPPWLTSKEEETMSEDLKLETGISGNKATLRITSEGGLVTTVTMGPDLARTIGRQLIGQADLIEPKEEENGQ